MKDMKVQNAVRYRRKKQLYTVVTILAAIVVFCTTYALVLPAITMEKETTCGLEEHTHTDECYEEQEVLVCGLEETEGHTHTDSCYTETKTLTCGLEETDGHTHTEACYDEDGNLICGQEEAPAHHHSDDCYTVTRELTCGLEECEPHQHTEECYEKEQVLICDKEEHTHSEECYAEDDQDSDPTADVETKADWEKTVAGASLTGNWNQDVLTIAGTQLGYTESTKNFQMDENDNKKGYTRYGAWYGDPYGDWCAMFASFCISYAKVDTSAMPIEASCNRWISSLNAKSLYHTTSDGYEAVPGDLIFFRNAASSGSDHVGIVVSNNGSVISTIEGNSSNCVQYNSYNVSDSRIVGYGEMPKNPNYDYGDEEEPAEDEEPVEDEEPAEEPEEDEEPADDTTIQKVYMDDDIVVTATYTAAANIPDDAVLSVEFYDEDHKSDDWDERAEEYTKATGDETQEMQFILYIGFYVDGEEVEPEDTVSVSVEFLDGELAGQTYTLVHFSDQGTEVVDTENEGGTVNFDTDSFSPFGFSVNERLSPSSGGGFSGGGTGGNTKTYTASDTVSLTVGDTEDAPIDATFSDGNKIYFSFYSWTWSSSDSSVASVNTTSGKITGVGSGNAIITGTTSFKFGNTTYTYKITRTVNVSAASTPETDSDISFTYTYTKSNVEYDLYFKCVDENGNTITTGTSKNVTSLSSTYVSSLAPPISGYTYQSAHLSTINGTTVTTIRTRTNGGWKINDSTNADNPATIYLVYKAQGTPLSASQSFAGTTNDVFTPSACTFTDGTNSVDVSDFSGFTWSSANTSVATVSNGTITAGGGGTTTVTGTKNVTVDGKTYSLTLTVNVTVKQAYTINFYQNYSGTSYNNGNTTVVQTLTVESDDNGNVTFTTPSTVANSNTQYEFYGWSTDSNTLDDVKNVIYDPGKEVTLAASAFSNYKLNLYAAWGDSNYSVTSVEYYIRFDGKIPVEPASFSTSLYTGAVGSGFGSGTLKYYEHIYNNTERLAANIINQPSAEDIVTAVNKCSSSMGGLVLEVNKDGKAVVKTASTTYSFAVGDEVYVVWYVLKDEASGTIWHIDGTLFNRSNWTLIYDKNCTESVNNIIPGMQYKTSESATVHNTYVNSKQVSTAPVRAGYIFTGWNTKADGTGTSYKDGDTIPKQAKGTTVTLYAQWSKDTMTARVYKTSSTDSTPLRNALFSFDDTSLLTGAEGYTDSVNIQADTMYTLQEVLAPVGYKANSTTVYFRLENVSGVLTPVCYQDAAGTTKLSAYPDGYNLTYDANTKRLIIQVTDEPDPAEIGTSYNVTVTKVDGFGNPLDGAEITLNEAELEETDENGQTTGTINLNTLYKLTETEGPDGYDANTDSLYFELQTDNVGTITAVICDENGAEIETAPSGWTVNGYDAATHTVNVTLIDANISDVPMRFSASILKYDENGDPLQGAQFAIYRTDDLNENGTPKDGASPVYTGTTGEDGYLVVTYSFLDLYTRSTIYMPLAMGVNYTAIETAAPEGYSAVNNFSFTVSWGGVQLDAHDDSNGVVALSSDSTVKNPNRTIEVNDKQSSGYVKITKTITGTETTLAGATFAFTKYETDAEGKPVRDNILTSANIGTSTLNDNGNVVTGEDGIVFEGKLEPGTYMLTETGAPAGYNALTSAITITVNADGTIAANPSNAVTSPKSITSDTYGSGYEIQIGNSAGEALPSTGGIGTHIFYIGGILMILAAGLVLLGRKRRIA